jgi:hypothetical protein
MRSPLKALLITGSLVAASLGGAASAAATSSPPTLDTSHFACSNGVCEIGPGNVGMSFAAGLYATAPNSPTFLIAVVSGSLPPGLQLASQNGDPWTITGTPTTAGTYAFTVQITASNTNGPYGPSATQQLTITIGTGSSDRPAGIRAGWNVHTGILGISGWDGNISALWSVSVTSSGRVLISNLPSRTTYPIDGFLVVQKGSGYPCPLGGCDLTVTNSLGSSVTVFLGRPIY